MGADDQSESESERSKQPEPQKPKNATFSESLRNVWKSLDEISSTSILEPRKEEDSNSDASIRKSMRMRLNHAERRQMQERIAFMKSEVSSVQSAHLRAVLAITCYSSSLVISIILALLSIAFASFNYTDESQMRYVFFAFAAFHILLMTLYIPILCMVNITVFSIITIVYLLLIMILNIAHLLSAWYGNNCEDKRGMSFGDFQLLLCDDMHANHLLSVNYYCCISIRNWHTQMEKRSRKAKENFCYCLLSSRARRS